MFDPDINGRVFRDWRHLLAFGFGSGLARYAPGTLGTLVALPFYLALSHLSAWQYAAVVLTAGAFGVWLCHSVSRDLQVHDHGGIVFDEFVGYWITMFMLPPTWPWVVAGFAAFRLFDIWKPGPIGWCDEHVHGGLGIMLDDVAAGVVACCVLHAIRVATGA